MEEDKTAVRLWRCWKTVNEMCRDRGYGIADDVVDMTFDEFRAKKCDADGNADRSKLAFAANPTREMMDKHSLPDRDDPTTLIPPPSDKFGSIWVEFSSKDKIGVQDIKKFAQSVTQNNFHTGILITQESKPTSHAQKIIPAVRPTVIELFPEEDLLINITKHVLVPKHVLLSEVEKKALLSRYRAKETQLPRILVTDAVAKYLGLQRGNVVKIIRRSETAGRYASYRCCV